jgi:hypothetical protein
MPSTRLFMALLVIFATVLDAQTGSVTSNTAAGIQVHRKIRDRELVAVRGGTYRLMGRKHRPLLLAFLQVVPDSAATSSRSEAVYLESMERQYGSRGLRIAAINAPLEKSDYKALHNELLNASYDWHLNIPLLEDANGSAVREFHVLTYPTLILIDGTGIIVQLWEGYTPPALLAQGIERLLGGPLGSIPKLTTK